MRRRTYKCSDTPTRTLSLEVWEKDVVVGLATLTWLPDGVWVEIPPGNMMAMRSFHDVWDALQRSPSISRTELEPSLLRYGFEPSK